MNRDDLQAWLDRYLDAWRTNDRSAIEGLFAPDAVYRWGPYGAHRILRGRDAIIEWWLSQPDEPGTWEARYEAWAVDDDRGVGVGTSRYLEGSAQPGAAYHMVFRMEFAPDGRCRSFVEHWLLEDPDDQPSDPSTGGADQGQARGQVMSVQSRSAGTNAGLSL